MCSESNTRVDVGKNSKNAPNNNDLMIKDNNDSNDLTDEMLMTGLKKIAQNYGKSSRAGRINIVDKPKSF